MLRGEKVTKNFGGLRALDEVDFEVGEGELVGLIGPNGSGKSTLFNLLSGIFRPDSGKIYLDGHDLSLLKPHEIAHLGVGRTFQIVRPFQGMSALNNVKVGILYGHSGGYVGSIEEQAIAMLRFVNLENRLNTPIKDFTLAEKKRLEVARALSTNPRLLLLDEVFAGLNPVEVQAAIQMIFRIRDELGITVFMIEHVLNALMETCQRVMVLSYGKKIAEGTPSNVVNNPEVIRVYLGADYAQS